MSPLDVLRGWMFVLVALVSLGLPAHAQDPASSSDTDAPGGVLGAVADLTDPLVRMKAGVIGDGLVRDNEFAAVHVRLENLGEPLVGELYLESRTSGGETRRYRRQVELPAGARKDVRLLFKPGIGGQTRLLQWRAGARSVDVEMPIRWVSGGDVAVGVIGDDAAGVNLVRETWSGRVPARAPLPRVDDYGAGGVNRSVNVGLIPTFLMPDRVNGLDIYNELVWVDADPTALSPEQTAALRAWVAGGGHLVLTVTERWRQVGQGPLADMMPVTLTGVRDGLGAARFVGGSEGQIAPQAVARPRPQANRLVDVLVQDGDDAIWTVGTYGLGTVHVLTIDPRLEPIARGTDRREFWQTVMWLPPVGSGASWFNRDGQTFSREGDLGPANRLGGITRLDPRILDAMDLTSAATVVGRGGYSYEEDVFGAVVENDVGWFTYVRDFLQDIPGVAPIPMEWLLAFASIYLLVIGPLDYFVLRTLKRQTWTWITFPVSIAVFSALALVGTSYVKGSQAVVTRYEVVDVLPGTDLWRGVSWYGVWSTRATTLSMTSGEGDGIAEIVESTGYKNDVETVHGTAGSALSWRAQTWTLAFARTSWTRPGTGGMTATRMGDGSVELRNDTGLDLTDVVVGVSNGTLIDHGALAAGEAVRFQPEGSGLRASYEPDYPDEALELESSREWAVWQAIDYPEVRRGHMDWSEWDLVVVGATTGPIEDSVLEGLTPNPRTHTLVRVPLRIRENTP